MFCEFIFIHAWAKAIMDQSFLNFNFVDCYEEFREHFPSDVADHSYDDVCQVVGRIVELLRIRKCLKKNWWQNTEQKNGRDSKIVDNSREIMETTACTSVRRHRVNNELFCS